MKESIKLDIISDVVCPWCVIGIKRLEQAVAELDIQERVELGWQPFEINPDMPPGGEEIQAYGTRKYSQTPEEGRRLRARLTALGAELGFTFDFFDGMRVVNTRDAHVLLDSVMEPGSQMALQMRLFTAFFSERKDVSERQVLARALQAAGLDGTDRMALLDDEAIRGRIQVKEDFWHDRGVSGVPVVIFNQSGALVGAQSVETYKRVLAGLMEIS